ncbi:MAG TPA: hypothetical protein VII50_10705 [Acidothermaceae bacterium]
MPITVTSVYVPASTTVCPLAAAREFTLIVLASLELLLMTNVVALHPAHDHFSSD